MDDNRSGRMQYRRGMQAYVDDRFRQIAKDEMANDNLRQTDVINVLERGSIYEPADLSTRGDWRYRVHTDRICVVVSFRSCTDLTVVTVWRKGGGK